MDGCHQKQTDQQRRWLRVELPCEFKFQGDNFSSNWQKIKSKKEKFDVLN